MPIVVKSKTILTSVIFYRYIYLCIKGLFEFVSGTDSDLVEESTHTSDQPLQTSSQQPLQQTVQPVPSTSSHVTPPEASGVAQPVKRQREDAERCVTLYSLSTPHTLSSDRGVDVLTLTELERRKGRKCFI